MKQSKTPARSPKAKTSRSAPRKPKLRLSDAIVRLFGGDLGHVGVALVRDCAVAATKPTRSAGEEMAE